MIIRAPFSKFPIWVCTQLVIFLWLSILRNLHFQLFKLTSVGKAASIFSSALEKVYILTLNAENKYQILWWYSKLKQKARRIQLSKLIVIELFHKI